MNDFAYPLIAERLFGVPLLIEPGRLRALADVLVPRVLGAASARVVEAPRAEEPLAPESAISLMKRGAILQRLATIVEADAVEVGDGMASYGVTPGGVAVLPVVGTLVQRFDWLAAFCGIQSYDSITLAAETAAADPRVKGGMLDVDSGGGEANGCFDAADRIAAAFAAAGKPLWGVGNSLACSAAYGLLAPAARIFAPRAAWLGSIGVVMLHVDRSRADEAQGRAYSAIFSGARKIDGWEHAPLAEEARARFQALCDGLRDQFCGHVARHRAAAGLDAAAARATEAGIFSDEAAVGARLADAVSPFDEALAELTEHVSKPARTISTPPTTSARTDMTVNATMTKPAGNRRARAEGGEGFTTCEGCQDPEGCKASGACANESGGAGDGQAGAEAGGGAEEEEKKDEGASAAANSFDARLDKIQAMPEAKGHDGRTLLRLARSNMPLADVKSILAATATPSGEPGALQLSARDREERPPVGPNAGKGGPAANPLLGTAAKLGLLRTPKG